MNYTTTIRQDCWEQMVDHVAATYESTAYQLDTVQLQVSFVGVAMLEAFVALHPDWLAA